MSMRETVCESVRVRDRERERVLNRDLLWMDRQREIGGKESMQNERREEERCSGEEGREADKNEREEQRGDGGRERERGRWE